jgi:hypothetical protein
LLDYQKTVLLIKVIKANMNIKLRYPGEDHYGKEMHFNKGDRIFLYVWDNGIYEGDLFSILDKHIQIKNARLIDSWNPRQIDHMVLEGMHEFTFPLDLIYGIEKIWYF